MHQPIGCWLPAILTRSRDAVGGPSSRSRISYEAAILIRLPVGLQNDPD